MGIMSYFCAIKSITFRIMKRLYIWLLVSFLHSFCSKENESAAKEQAKREKLDKQSQVFAYEGYKAGKANKTPRI